MELISVCYEKYAVILHIYVM